MEIHHDEGKKGSFFIESEDERVAELQYFHSGPRRINIYHTEVGERLTGQGVGKKLVEKAVAYAREQNLKLTATCPFARKVIDRTPEFQDVLADTV